MVNYQVSGDNGQTRQEHDCGNGVRKEGGGGQSVKQAAELHGVPRTTLQDCVKGKVKHGVNLRPQPYLQPAEEKELSCYLTEVAAVGYGRTKKQVKLQAEMVAKDEGVLRSTTKNKAGKVSDLNISGDSCRVRRPLPFEGEIQQPKYEWKPAVQRQ